MTVRSNLVLTTELSKLATLKGSFFTLYGGQFTFSTQLLTLNYLFLKKSVLNEKIFKESDLPKFETTEAKILG